MLMLFCMVGAIVLHESAHYVCARTLHVKVICFGANWRGAYLIREPGTDSQNVVISASWPVCNLLFADMVFACPWLHYPAVLFGLCNFILGAYNLLPLPGSDGLRILRTLTGSVLERATK